MNKILDIILCIALIFFIVSLLQEIKINAELEEPSECVIINNQYYCRIDSKIEDKSFKM